jgi:uncharacterized protein (TIGR03000 family)
MYSVVLATMLMAGTTSAPDWGCRGCYGCCNGCCGGYYSCCSCCGCCGCYGGFYSHGCCGCCAGGWCSGCYGCCCSGGCYGWYTNWCGCCGGYYSCYGCCGCCCGGVVILQPAYVAPAAKVLIGKSDAASTAKVIVQLPADARMSVDGQLADLTSATRSFVTPELEPGKDYYYTIQAEATRDGQVRSKSQRVIVRAGQTSRVDFGDLTGTVATIQEAPAPAHLTVQLPESARLFVDNVACPQTSSKRSFDTPKLEPGKTYYYTLRAELVRDGQTVSESRRVDVKAGKEINVSFGDMTSLAQR